MPNQALMLKYELVMRVPLEGYVPPEVIAHRFPFLEVIKGPSELEVARAKGLLHTFILNQSMTPEELLDRLSPHPDHEHLFNSLSTNAGIEFSIQRKPTAQPMWELYAPAIMHEPEVLMLTEIIAIIDYLGGLADAQ